MKAKALYPTARATLTNLLAPKVQAGAEEFADRLRENVSAGSRSGTQYPSLPRRSSAPSEFPQEQFGDLKASVDTQPTNNPLVWRAGFIGDDQTKLNALEYGSRHMAERAPLQRTSEQPATRAAILKAAKEG